MTATTATTIAGLPRNKTGLFAADTLQEVKSLSRSQSTQPTGFVHPNRNTGFSNLIRAAVDQSPTQLQQYRLAKHEVQQYYRNNRNPTIKVETTNDSYSTSNGLRNAFRPSPVRRQKLQLTSSVSYRDSKDLSSKHHFIPSPASSKLRSEIEHIHSKIKLHGDISKLLRLPPTRESAGTPRSALSHATSCRLSSASTNYVADRIHQRYPSAMTTVTANTLVSTAVTIETTNKSLQSLSGVSIPSPTTNFEDRETNRTETAPIVTHAYQVPQQSNLGADSIFPINPPPSPSSIKTCSSKNDHRTNNKSKSYPFYVMYFSNLTMQQQQQQQQNSPTIITTTHNNTETEKKPIIITTPAPTPAVRKRTANSRSGTAVTRHQPSRQNIRSPINLNSQANVDDNDSVINSTSYYNSKRFSAKIAAFEKENSYLLKDVLRTTAWNHVQV